MEDRITSVVGRISFNDWRFRIGGGNAEERWLQVEFDAPDSFTGVDDVQRGRKWRLSEHMTDSEIVQTALVAVMAAVEHETREDFRYRGAAIFGPHYNVESLVGLVGMDSAHDTRSLLT